MTVKPSGGSSDARRYAALRYRVLLGSLLSGVAFLIAFQWSGLSRATSTWWSTWDLPEAWLIAGYLAVFGSAYYLVMLPLHLYSSFLLEHRFGLSRLSVRGWLLREAKQITVSTALGLALVEGLYALLRHAPTTWPQWATLGWVLFSVVLARLFPTVLLPIFYKTVPLEDERFVGRLLALCRRAGVSALGVFRVDLGAETRKANAALTGLGGTRRVLLSDTLLSAFPVEEIEGVLAHELGHQRYRHLLQLLVVSAVGSWIAFHVTAVAGQRWVEPLGLRNLADIAGFPMLMLWLSVLGLLGLPLQNGFSRRLEWQADRFAVETTRQPRVYAAALRRLGDLNLADPNPPRWVEWLFYDHPPIIRRIQAAEAAYK